MRQRLCLPIRFRALFRHQAVERGYSDSEFGRCRFALLLVGKRRQRCEFPNFLLAVAIERQE
jgi:hypothetical protein